MIASGTAKPLVSCVVSTADRPSFIAQLVRCFLRQTWEAKELIIVDSGRQPVEDFGAGVSGVRQVRASAETSLAERLNLGIESSRGTIVQKLDDDDYYHPRFLERAIATLLSDAPAKTIVSWDCFYVVLKGDRALRFSGHGWSAGGTLCFTRELWEQTRFRGNGPSDYFFIHDSGAALRRVCAPEMYLHVRHGGNMWQVLHDRGVDEYFRALPPAGMAAADLVEADDAAFYEWLCEP